MPKGALGKPVGGVDLAVISPDTGEECPPAEIDADGRLLNVGDAIGEIVNRSGRGSFEGYYQRRTPSGSGCAAAGTGPATSAT